MKGIVPQEILQRKDKIGFEIKKDFLISQKNKIIEKINAFNEVPLLDTSKLLKYLNNLDKLKLNEFSEVWRIINYSSWFKLNF